jgi:hypothetical protein
MATLDITPPRYSPAARRLGIATEHAGTERDRVQRARSFFTVARRDELLSTLDYLPLSERDTARAELDALWYAATQLLDLLAISAARSRVDEPLRSTSIAALDALVDRCWHQALTAQVGFRTPGSWNGLLSCIRPRRTRVQQAWQQSQTAYTVLLQASVPLRLTR